MKYQEITLSNRQFVPVDILVRDNWNAGGSMRDNNVICVAKNPLGQAKGSAEYDLQRQWQFIVEFTFWGVFN